MATQTLEANYLIVGSGAVGMIFADQMLTESNARMIIVDRRAMPGGHWNDSYPFVRLHQPSAYYGAGSRALGVNRIDDSGLNKGYYEQASGAEVRAYFEALMRERFLPSGRIQYLPMSEYVGGDQIKSRISGETTGVRVGKIVDTTFFNTEVPATHTRSFGVAEDVALTAPHLLARDVGRHGHYCIVGAGKTAMDVGVWLLQMGADPASIRWIAPRDSWLINREITQPGDDFYASNFGGLALQLEAAAEASSVRDLFARLEQAGQLLRIDRDVAPTMYRGATMSVAEVEVLRQIKDVVRRGRVRAITGSHIELDEATIDAKPNTLYIDCSARALGERAPKPVFDGNVITLQLVRAQLVSISAALIAHVEANYEGDGEKNDLCRPIPPASSDIDWLRTMLADLRAARRWSMDKPLRKWVADHRLSGFGSRGAGHPDAKNINACIRAARPLAEANLARLLSERDASAFQA
ncbi:MAG: NAD(P)/FAD-dependent oxidoreductase [Proteobacteria bacterium]|nr:NAD(P)/FAD-dependent oxidoreductase [Pseudomonadota bacterium]